jgi:hypothetical protein
MLALLLCCACDSALFCLLGGVVRFLEKRRSNAGLASSRYPHGNEAAAAGELLLQSMRSSSLFCVEGALDSSC